MLEQKVDTPNQPTSYLPIENMLTQKPTNPANQKHDINSPVVKWERKRTKINKNHKVVISLHIANME